MTFTQAMGQFFEQSGLRAFAPNQRTDGLGQWRHEAAHTFTVTSISVIAFDTLPNPPAPGFLAGWSTLSQTIELNESDRFHIAIESHVLRRERTGVSHARVRHRGGIRFP